MIGTAAEAQQIAFMALEDPWKVQDGLLALPEGWSFLGSGCSRVAYRSPSGVAYKVPRGRGYNSAQDCEWLTYLHLSLQPLPEGWDLPKTGRFHAFVGNHEITVIAMELFEGDESMPDFSKINTNIAHEHFGIFDPHSGNLRHRADGTIVPIDLGFSNHFSNYE